MATLLIGYDVEMGGELTKRFLEKVTKLHIELNAPCTLFIKGELIEENKEALLKLKESGLFDLQQHTYSHLPLKTVAQEINGELTLFREGGSLEEIYQEVEKTSHLLKESLGVDCIGIAGPYGYYRGLIDRPDILKVLHGLGIRFTRTYGRNAQDWQPVPFKIQPFWYEVQGFPDILEFPIQGWCDILWRGYYGTKGYFRYLKRQIDRLVEMDLCWSYQAHDWVSLRRDPEMEMTKRFIEYAHQKGVELSTHLDYYRREEKKRFKPTDQPKEKPLLVHIKTGLRYPKFTQKNLRILVLEPEGSDDVYLSQASTDTLRILGHEVSIKEVSIKKVKDRSQVLDQDFLNGLVEMIKIVQPDFIFSINHLGLVPELLAKLEIPYASWFTDNPLYYIDKHTIDNKFGVFFVADRFYVNRLRALGFERVYHLPRAANLEVFNEMKPGKEELERYEAELSFHGDSHYASYIKFTQFLRKTWDLNIRDILDETINLEAGNPSQDISDILESVQSSFQAWIPFETERDKRAFERDLELFILSDKQKKTIERIAHFQPHLYGDNGWLKFWEGLLSNKVKFCGEIGYRELPRLYHASKINLNITHIQNKTSLEQKIFDVSGCGEFVLTDYRREMEDMFNIGKEIAFYRDTDDLKRKIEYFLNHPDERLEMASSAQKRVKREHTYELRIRFFIRIMREIFTHT